MKHIVLDTDIFGDPDDIFALVYALSHPDIQIDLIVTSDEHRGMRAAQLRVFLEALGENIPVVPGIDLGNTKYVFTHVESPQPSDQSFLTAIHDVIQKNDDITYVCIAPQSNLAAYAKRYPETIARISVVAMGSSIKEFFGRVEHNVRLDVPAVQTTSSLWDISWVLADHTVSEELSYTRDGAYYQYLLHSTHPAAMIMKRSIDDFLDTFKYDVSYLHDPLTISSLVDPFVVFRPATVVFDEAGKMTEVPDGHKTHLSERVDYSGFATIFLESSLAYLKSR